MTNMYSEEIIDSFLLENFDSEAAAHYKFLVSSMIMVERKLMKTGDAMDIIDIVSIVKEPKFHELYQLIKNHIDTTKKLPTFVKRHMQIYFRTI